jgi:hypothetical protein
MTFCFFMWKALTGGHRTCCRPQIPTILPSPYRRGLGSVLSEVRLDAVETNEVEGVRSHKRQRRLSQTIMNDPILAFERLPASLYHRRQAGNPDKRDRLTSPRGEGEVSLPPKATKLRPPVSGVQGVTSPGGSRLPTRPCLLDCFDFTCFGMKV